MQLSNLSVDPFFFAKVSFQLYFRLILSKSTSHIVDNVCGNFHNFNFIGLFTALVTPLPVACRLTVRLSSFSDYHNLYLDLFSGCIRCLYIFFPSNCISSGY